MSQPKWVLIGLLWAAYVLNHADRQVLYTLFPALQAEFGLSNTMLGMMGALFLWIYGLASPFAGVLGDRWPKPTVIAGSLALWSFFTVLSGFAPEGYSLLVCRALLGISESLFMPAAFALMANAHSPETRSKAIALFATSQMVGVAFGGSLGGLIAERLSWRASFWLLGAVGLAYSWPLYKFLQRLPAHILLPAPGAAPARMADFFRLLRVPSLQVVSAFVAVATFGLYLVYTWLPTFLYDKFQLGLEVSGREAALYPQAGTLAGLFLGGIASDAWRKTNPAARFWIVLMAFCAAGPCIYLLGAASALSGMRLAAAAFGFCSGLIIANQAPSAFDVVPATYRATAAGILNLVGCLVSGFAPYLGGLARGAIGIDQLMAATGACYLLMAAVIVYAALRLVPRDVARAAN